MHNIDNLKTKEGLIVGLDAQGDYYRVDGYQHLFLMAPTGAGKGVAFVIPNLLSWQESVIVHDIKMENYQITSGWRASQGQKIYLWDPLNKDGKTHCYNPLDFLSKDHKQMVNDIEKIAHLLLPEHEFWHNQARRLLVALILYLVAHKDKPTTFGEIYRMLMGDLVAELKGGITKLQLSEDAILLINFFLNKEAKEFAGIVTTLVSHLEPWANPLIDSATSRSDFNPANFRKEKSTLYVGLQPGDIERLKPLMRFFYQHIAQNLIKSMPDSNQEPHGVLFLLDEFPSLGKMDMFTSSIPYFRGYKVRLMIVAQNLNDLKSTYCDKAASSILANSSLKVAFGTSDFDTANYISNLCVDHVKHQVSMSWQEVMSLTNEKQILLGATDAALICKKLHYYDVKELKDRVMEPKGL
jgi:type IV secretion system protein VirD4